VQLFPAPLAETLNLNNLMLENGETENNLRYVEQNLVVAGYMNFKDQT